jgi:hypothetical protein
VQTRSTTWLAWMLWVLTLLGLAVIAWLDRLLRLAGRPELTWSQDGSAPNGVAAVSAATVGRCWPAVSPATRWGGCCLAWACR